MKSLLKIGFLLVFSFSCLLLSAQSPAQGSNQQLAENVNVRYISETSLISLHNAHQSAKSSYMIQDIVTMNDVAVIPTIIFTEKYLSDFDKVQEVYKKFIIADEISEEMLFELRKF